DVCSSDLPFTSQEHYPETEYRVAYRVRYSGDDVGHPKSRDKDRIVPGLSSYLLFRPATFLLLRVGFETFLFTPADFFATLFLPVALEFARWVVFFLLVATDLAATPFLTVFFAPDFFTTFFAAKAFLTGFFAAVFFVAGFSFFTAAFFAACFFIVFLTTAFLGAGLLTALVTTDFFAIAFFFLIAVVFARGCEPVSI